MADIPRNVDWIAELVPDLSAKAEPFRVDTDEVDDELIEVFIDEIKRLVGELQEGLAANDPELVRMASHSVKGMGGTIGLPEVSVLGLEIENLAKEDRVPDADEMINGLAKWLNTFC